MPPTLNRIAQTSSEAKKQHKKNGPQLPARQRKQLERAHELDLRAARAREAEDRRKAALKKRKEREEKENAARKQIGVGLATQLIGYSHTQAQLKNGMEAFLGVSKRREEEKRKKELDLLKKLDVIAQSVDKEPWDDDDDTDDFVLDLPSLNVSSEEQHIKDDLDDDTLLEAHDLVKSDPVQELPTKVKTLSLPATVPVPVATKCSPNIATDREDVGFVRLHGPINRAIEKILDQLPHPLIELLSLDSSMKLPDWEPTCGLLHKLNPIGLPPHRLRLKVGSVVTLLRDLNTSSQLSKSQHLRILRAENERLECLVLDGQLQGTKTFLTRVPFFAKYRNDDQFPFRRTQFPIRVATDYVQSNAPPREPSGSGFKLPTVAGRASLSSHRKAQDQPLPNAKRWSGTTNSFKLPGQPASKSLAIADTKPAAISQHVLNISTTTDGWDDFLESATQIARELSVETPVVAKRPSPPTTNPSYIADSIPPLSTQDLNFSMEDLDEVEISPVEGLKARATEKPLTVPPKMTIIAQTPLPSVQQKENAVIPTTRRQKSGDAIVRPAKPLPSRHDTNRRSPLPDLTTLRASQRPPSVSDRPGLKRKSWVPPPKPQPATNKRRCTEPPRPAVMPKAKTANTTFSDFSDFILSTQDAASFFVDDDELSFGSPPIAV